VRLLHYADTSFNRKLTVHLNVINSLASLKKNIYFSIMSVCSYT